MIEMFPKRIEREILILHAIWHLSITFFKGGIILKGIFNMFNPQTNVQNSFPSTFHFLNF